MSTETEHIALSIRAARAALTAHVQSVGNEGEPWETMLTDLLADLRHLARTEGIDYGDVDGRAAAHVYAETHEYDSLPEASYCEDCDEPLERWQTRYCSSCQSGYDAEALS
jgi:hypothetical protein